MTGRSLAVLLAAIATLGSGTVSASAKPSSPTVVMRWPAWAGGCEGHVGTTELTFTVGLSERPRRGRPVTAMWTTADGASDTGDPSEWATSTDDPLAPDDHDYLAASGTLTWTHDDYADKRLTVVVNGDVARENHEWFSVIVSPTSGDDLRGRADIYNDDAEIVSC